MHRTEIERTPAAVKVKNASFRRCRSRFDPGEVHNRYPRERVVFLMSCLKAAQSWVRRQVAWRMKASGRRSSFNCPCSCHVVRYIPLCLDAKLVIDLVCYASYISPVRRASHLAVERKLVEFHEFEERTGNLPRLADGSSSALVVRDGVVYLSSDVDSVGDVQLRVPVFVPFDRLRILRQRRNQWGDYECKILLKEINKVT